MLNQLKKIYPSLIIGNKSNQISASNYQWYTTKDNDVVGIKMEEIQDNNEEALLNIFLTPYDGTHLPVTHQEKNWSRLLLNEELNDLTSFPKEFRFVYFSLSEPLSDPIHFQEAINGLYPNKPVIIWNNSQEGVIIEEERYTEEEAISYGEMIDVFISDFYLDLKLYVGPHLTNIKRAPIYYAWIKRIFPHLVNFNVKPVITYVTSVPYLLSSLTNKADHQLLIEAILKETKDDDELLRTIQTFLECNLNISLAAKKMYMHRNSLQYRIDKFIEKTEIDVKQFEGALSVYLILLLKKRYE